MTAPDPRLGEIEARLGGITEGFWSQGRGITPYVAKRDWVEVYGRATIASDVRPKDAEFIANAPADVAYLRSVVEAQAGQITKVREMHRPVSQDFITALDCIREECDCENECKTEPLDVCLHCWSQLEQIDPYFGENHHVSEVMWPCPTIAALAPEGPET